MPKLILLFLVLTSCFDPIVNTANNTITPDTNSGGEIDQFTRVQAVLANCTGCHTTYNSKENLINQPGDKGMGTTLVVPGDPGSSSLYLSLLGPIEGTSVGLMPQGGPALGASDISTVREWIESLASESTQMMSDEMNFVVTNETNNDPDFIAFKSVIQNKCMWCHRAGGSYEGLDHYNLDTVTAWLESGYINPGDATNSRIVQAMQGNGLQQMPPNNLSQVSQADIAKVEKWINAQTGSTGGGGGGGGGTTPAQMRFNAVRMVFTNSCTGCHRAGRAFGGLQLDYTTEAEMINGVGNRIVQGNANNSTLYLRTQGSGGGNADMPTNNNNFNQVNVIRDWIDGLQ